MHQLLHQLNTFHKNKSPFSTGFFEVNLKNLEENIQKIRNKNTSHTPNHKYLLPVKGNGYGCGMKEIALFVQKRNLVDYLGVAHPQEAFELRENGITMPILLLGQTVYSERFIQFFSEKNIEIAISERQTLSTIEQYYKKYPHTQTLSVHLKIDIGMGRCGVLESDAIALCKKIIASKAVTLKGVMMHFPVADYDSSYSKQFQYTEQQIQKFCEIQKRILDITNTSIIFHAANSGGVIEHDTATFDMVRVGIASYGYPDPSENAKKLNLKPIVKVYSSFSMIKRFPQNFPIGYGQTYYTQKDNEYIGIIPIGYADGLNRLLSNSYSIFSCTNEFPCVGRISMDQSTYVISDNQNNSRLKQEKVYILGDKQNAYELAQKLNTIPYEVLLHFGNSHRLRKIYIYE